MNSNKNGIVGVSLVKVKNTAALELKETKFLR